MYCAPSKDVPVHAILAMGWWRGAFCAQHACADACDGLVHSLPVPVVVKGRSCTVRLCVVMGWWWGALWAQHACLRACAVAIGFVHQPPLIKCTAPGADLTGTFRTAQSSKVMRVSPNCVFSPHCFLWCCWGGMCCGWGWDALQLGWDVLQS